jgi:phosphate transport system permease protein
MTTSSIDAPQLATAAGAVPEPGTTLPVRSPENGRGGPEPRRVLATWRVSDVLALAGSAVGAAGLTWLLFTQLLPFSGAFGALAVWYVAFLVLYAVLVSFDESRQAVRDRLVAVVVHSIAVVLLAALAFVITYVVVRGAGAMTHLNLYTRDMSTTGPLQPLSSGGVLHGIVGTLIEIGISLVITVPLGLSAAVFLTEFPGPFARVVRTVVEAMTALPSVVAGLFVFSTWVLILHNPQSGMAAAFALSVMALPIIVRAADVVLRLVPGSLTEASLALGASRWRTVWSVTLPTAKSGLATAVILGTARAIGETSPVLLTAGYGNDVNFDPTSGPMDSLPLLAYELRRFPSDAMVARAFGAASILLIIVLALFGIARAIGGRGAGVLTARQQRRRLRQSQRDAERFIAGTLTRRELRERARDDPPGLGASATTATAPESTARLAGEIS